MSDTNDQNHSRREWWVDGVLHREDGPAVITRTDELYEEKYFLHGDCHRTNGPAITRISTKEREKGITKRVEKFWYCADECHRDHDQPAIIKKTYINGELDSCQYDWRIDGYGIRKDPDKPSRVVWQKDGEFHFIFSGRAKAPKTGLVQCSYNRRIWRRNGLIHNEKGPAVIDKKEDGSLLRRYCLDGKEYRFKWWSKIVNLHTGPRIASKRRI